MTHSATTAALNRLRAWLAWLEGAAPPADSSLPNAKRQFQPDHPLESIFCRIKPDSDCHPSPPAPQYWPRAPLSLAAAVFFPTTAPPTTSATSLLAALTQINAALTGDPERDLERMLYAFQRYAWCLPSPARAISLYDWARVDAACAAAQSVDPGPPYLLIGDLSGVQEFIYTLTAKGATRQLRGRSFYLQLLTDAIAHALLSATGMPLTNLLYSGGGRFDLLLPHPAQHQLDAFRTQIGSLLLRRHRGALYVALGGAVYPIHDDAPKLAAVQQEALHAVNREKQRRFAALGEDALADYLFSPFQPPFDMAVMDADASVPADPLSQSLEELARELHNTIYLLVSPQPFNSSSGSPATPSFIAWKHVLKEYGLELAFGTSPTPSHPRQLAMQDPPTPMTGTATVVTGMRYVAAVAPAMSADDVEMYRQLAQEGRVDQDISPFAGNIKPFGMLVEQSEGVKRLGVLRMDVDDLGSLFGKRLDRPDGLAGLATTASLSAALSRFFEGHVAELCRQQNEQHGNLIYTIYSGGDDLFIVGAWHLLPDLAWQIRQDFVRFTTAHSAFTEKPPLTLSAGITLHPSKFPLYQAAEEAGEALDAAKGYTRQNGCKKDAFTFLGRTLGWEHYADVAATHATLNALMEGDVPVPRALLMTLQALAQQYEANRTRRTRNGTQKIVYGPWVWRGAYTLTRLAERASNDKRQPIETLRDRLMQEFRDDVPFVVKAGLAARWTQLRIRGTNK